MTQVDNITDAADQLIQVVLDDGSILQIQMLYRATTQRWTANLSHSTLTLNGLNICVSANMLRDFRNIIAFGLSCDTTDGQDPINIEDFINGNATLYVLNEADVIATEEQVFGGILQ